MKLSRNDVPFILGLLACILFAMLLFGCSVSKSSQKVGVDSTVIKEYQDSVRILKTDNERLEKENIQMRYFGFDFDTSSHPCDTAKTVITIHDGDISVSGRLKSAHFSEKAINKTTETKEKKVDSSGNKKAKESYKVITRTITTTVKRWYIPWWVWVVMIGLVVFNFRKQIKNII